MKQLPRSHFKISYYNFVKCFHQLHFWLKLELETVNWKLDWSLERNSVPAGTPPSCLWESDPWRCSPSSSLSFSVMYSPVWYFLLRHRRRFLLAGDSPSARAALPLPWNPRCGRGFERGLPLGRRVGWLGVGEGGREAAGGGGIGGGGGEGVAKPQRSSRASSARRRPLLSLGKELSVASVSLLGTAALSRDAGVSSRRGPLPLSVTD